MVISIEYTESLSYRTSADYLSPWVQESWANAHETRESL